MSSTKEIVDKDRAPSAEPAEAPETAREPRPPRLLNARNLERLLSLLSPLILLAIWELAALAGQIDTRFFPPPSSVVVAFWNMTQSGELVNCRGSFLAAEWCAGSPNAPAGGHLGITLIRVSVGFLIGAVPGIIVGLAMGLFGPIRAIFQPLVDGTFPIPKIAVLPLFIMIFGLGEASKYAIIAVAVIYLVLINTVAGVRNIDMIYLDVGHNYRASRLMMFTDVALPGALLPIMAGLKLGMGVALLVIVAAEFVGATSGIGYLIWTSWQVFQVDKMYVGLMVSALLGFATAILLNYLERVLIPWKQR